MAYTYENFTTAATNAGLLDGFSQDDLKIAQTNPEYGLSMLKLRQDYANATTAEQKLLAQEAENQLRTSYGSLNTGTTGSFNYGKQNEYQKLLDEVTNYKPFEYDPSADPSYGAYRKQYLREADRARQDTMAQASAMSGGRPSTYAITAAQQAGNYYTGQLNDAIPTLQQNAYQRYLNDYNAKLSGLDALSADREFDYNKYLQEWNNAMTLYQMGIRTPEIRALLGIPEPKVGGYYVDSDSSVGTVKNPNPNIETETEQPKTNTVQPGAGTGYIPPTFTLKDQLPLFSTTGAATSGSPNLIFSNPKKK